MRSAALLCSLPWLRSILLAAIAFGAASCSSDSSRLGDRIIAPNGARPSAELTGAVQSKPAQPINSTTLPPPSAQVSPATSSVTLPPPAPRVAAGPPAKPASNPTTPPARNLPTHTVVSGDTLHKIARHHNVSVAELSSANNITTNTKLKPGSQLVIPAARPANVAQPKVNPEAKPKVAMAESNARTITPTQNLPTENKTAEAASLTFRWPVRGRVIAGFGPKPSGQQNDGINFAVPEGTPVKAAEEGVVVYANNELKTYGNLVLIRHSNGFVTAYAHVSEILVKRDEVVKRGQVIAKAGQTGNVSTPQLHFEIRKGQVPVDPMIYLERSPGA